MDGRRRVKKKNTHNVEGNITAPNWMTSASGVIAIGITLILILLYVSNQNTLVPLTPSGNISSLIPPPTSSLQEKTFYLAAHADDTDLSIVTTLSKDREKELFTLIQSDPSLALRSALPPRVSSLLRNKNVRSIEDRSSIEGELVIEYDETFTEKGELTSHDEYYYLDTGNPTDEADRIQLYFTPRARETINPLIGKSILRLNNPVIVSNWDTRVKKHASHVAGVDDMTIIHDQETGHTVKELMVVIIKFQDTVFDPSFTTNLVRSQIFTGATATKPYYLDNSFNNLVLVGRDSPDGDIYGPVQIPYNTDPTNCRDLRSTYSNSAQTILQNQGVSFSGYDHYMYLIPCGVGGGTGNMGGSTTWIYISTNGSGGVVSSVAAHELGHNFGLSHTNGYRCTVNGVDVPISTSGNCSTITYADAYDPMGSGGASACLASQPWNTTLHFNTFNKGRVNYYQSSNTQTVSQNGTYFIHALETLTTGVQALRIQRTSSDYYYLEARKPVGFDTPLGNIVPPNNSCLYAINGVSIRIAPAYSSSTGSKLIDTNQTLNANGYNNFRDAPLQVGQTFTDPAAGVTITTQSITSTGAYVNVVFGTPTCTRANPTVTLSPIAQWGNAGQVLPYTVSVHNNDTIGCTPSTFTIVPQFPSGWSQSPNPLAITAAPGATVGATINVTSSPTASGSVNFTETATNTTAPSYSGVGSATYNVNPGDTTPPTISIAAPSQRELATMGPIRITANAMDASGIYDIRFNINGTLRYTCTLPNPSPCTFIPTPSMFNPGTNIVQATARDNSVAQNSASTSITIQR